MTDYTTQQWQQQARSVAINTGLDPAIFSALVQQESSWNPTAQGSGSSAYGFTQLTNAAASDAGVDKFDPMQNLQGGATYLKSLLNKFGGDYTMALSAYNQGAGKAGNSAGLSYAKSVLLKAKNYVTGGVSINDVLNGLAPMGSDKVGGTMKDAATAAKDAALVGLDKALESVPVIGQIWNGAKAAGVPDIFTASEGTCGINPVCYLQKWFDETDFIQRFALFIIGTIFIIGAIVFLAIGYKPIQDATKAALV